MDKKKLLLTWIIAFAMAFTVIPSTVVCASEGNTEPTNTAPEMTEGDGTETPGNLNENPTGDTTDPTGEIETTEEVEQTEETSEPETEETTASTT